MRRQHKVPSRTDIVPGGTEDLRVRLVNIRDRRVRAVGVAEEDDRIDFRRYTLGKLGGLEGDDLCALAAWKER